MTTARVDPTRMILRRGAALLFLLLVSGASAEAWPHDLTKAIARDALRLLPESLARLLHEREDEIAAEWTRLPAPLQSALAADLVAGELRDETMRALDAHAEDVLRLFAERRVSEGLLRLGALARFPVDFSDPILTVGPAGYPAGVAREYYAFIAVNLDKIPVTLSRPEALDVRIQDLGAYWNGVLLESRRQSVVLRKEMIRGERIVDHRLIDYRSPVFAVSSLSYSRAVTAVAATWLAVWRRAGGDVTRMRQPSSVEPSSSRRVSPSEVVTP
ncbi:MAG: hypothetical protein JXO72_00790 [Vicinamibacteria bacterium]|nr:hypothetical protein [Vicinamibacteria bacterium]